MSSLQNCWEIKECGRASDGPKAEELGECIASVEGLGHSCWAIAGTLCDGVVQGTIAQKEENCTKCDVFRLYNRATGVHGMTVITTYSQEDAKLKSLLIARIDTH